jgi:ABC-type phosphate transport system substrate-binding protein
MTKKQFTVVAGALLLGLLGASQAVVAGDVIVIAHSSVNASADELRDIFIGEKQSAGGTKLVPVDNGAVQADFLAKVVKVDANKYAAIWAKKGFREGINPPAVKGSDTEVIAFVKSTPGAIGYVTHAPADAKVLAKF